MKKAKKYLEYRQPPKRKEYEIAMRIAYLEGILEYNIWADAIQNGNDICDKYEKELNKLTKEIKKLKGIK